MSHKFFVSKGRLNGKEAIRIYISEYFLALV